MSGQLVRSRGATAVRSRDGRLDGGARAQVLTCGKKGCGGGDHWIRTINGAD